MLKIKDGTGKIKFILRDEDDEPLSIDEMILNDSNEETKKKRENTNDAKDEASRG